MSAPPQGPRGGRGPRSRGGGRGGAHSARTRPSDGNESDAGSTTRRAGSRGRPRATNSQNDSKGIAQAFQQVTRQQNAPRGVKGPRVGSRAATPSANGPTTAVGQNNKETPEERWSRLRIRREDERHVAIRNGLMSGSGPRSLKYAITMVGTCQEMCAEFERAQRIYQKDVWRPEMDTIVENGETKRVVNEKKMVKKFQRSAAGIDEQLPSDLRPPAVLLKTAEYLFNDLLSDEDSLVQANTFIWDRTRAIRNDFSIQQVKKVADVRVAIECYEKIARYHILSLHQIGGKGQERAGDSYNWQQDREQLDKTLLSLLTYYEQVKKRYRSPNEAEFRSYWIIFQIGNFTASVEDKVQTWSIDLLRHPRILRALDMYAAASDVIDYKGPLQPRAPLAIAQQHWQKFWNLVGSKQTSYLMSCVAEIGFNIVRRIVLTTISMAYYPGGKKEIQDWTLEKMTEVLGFDDEDATRDFLEQSNLEIGHSDSGTQYLKLPAVRRVDGMPDPTAELQKQVHSWHLVERKRFGRSFPAVIAGMSFKIAKENGMLVPDWDEEVRAHSGQEDGLFVGEGSDEEELHATKAPAKANPFASTFAPAPSKEEGKPSPFGAFGQPSAVGQPSSSFGQTSTPSPFGQPIVASTTPQVAAPSTVTPTGSFSALPKPFSFPSPSAPTSSTPGAPAATTLSNPFAAAVAATTSAAPAQTPSASSPFASFVPKHTTESAQTSSNPFASLVNGSGTAAPQPSSSLFAAPSTAKTPSIPLVRITSPQGDLDQPKVNGEVAKTKSSLEFPSSAGCNFSPKSAPAKPSVPPSTSTASPFTFSSNLDAAFAPKITGITSTGSASNGNFTAAQGTKPVESKLGAPPKPTAQSNFSYPNPQSTPFAPTQPAASNNTPTQALLPHFSLAKPATGVSASTSVLASTPTPSLFAAPALASKLPQGVASSPVTTTSVLTTQNIPVAQTWEQTRETNGWDYISEQLCCDADRGYFKQYVKEIAHSMIVEAIRDEEIRATNEQADHFRWCTLAYRYGIRWRKVTTTLRSRRKRLEMKKRNAEIKQKRLSAAQLAQKGMGTSTMSLEEELAAFRADRENQKSIKEDATAREQERIRLSLQEERQRHTARTSATNSFDLIGQRHVEPMAPPARPKPRDAVPAASRGHQRSKTQPNALAPNNGLYRVSKPSKEDSPALSTSTRSSLKASLINGGSLADSGLPFGKKASTMQSPYFRLKAAGFGPTWKKDFSSSILGIKRSRLSGDDILANGSLHSGTSLPAPAAKRLRSPAEFSSFSSPVRPPQEDSLAASFGSSTSSNGAYRRPADDEDLLARARKLRRMLEDDEAWFKEEVDKDELRRSQEFRRSQLGSRPVSQAGSPKGPNGEDLAKLPKFYSRESRFVPREQYGVRIEKKEVKDEPKGKGKVNGTRLSNGTGGRGAASRQVPPPAPPKPANHGGTSWDDAIEL